MRQAIVLAAGEGQRLRPFTVSKPKVMLSIAGKPILQYIIESLVQNGIRNILLVVGYRKEQVLDYIGSGEQLGASVTYVTQEKQLGTAHALAQAETLAEPEFLVLPGDNLIEANTLAKFIAAEPEALLVKRVEDPARYGVVTMVNGIVKGISEKPREAPTNIINTGIYAFSREVFSFIEPELHIPDVLNKMISLGKAVTAVETTGTWLDVAYPWDILRLNDAILREVPPRLGGTIERGAVIKGRVSVGKTTVIRSNCYISGPVVIGDHCDIGPSVCVLPATSIGNNVTISAFSEIRNSVIGNDASIGPGCIIEDSVIDEGCAFKGRFTAISGRVEVKLEGEYHTVDIGAMLGEGCTLGSSVVARAGTIAGNYVQVQDSRTIEGKLPNGGLVV